MTLAQILSHLDSYGVKVVVRPDGSRGLGPTKGIDTADYRRAVREIIPHLQARWAEYLEHVYRLRDAEGGDWRENPETDGRVYRIERPYVSPAERRQRLYRNTIELAEAFDSRVYGACSYNTRAKPLALEWHQLKALHRFPKHWTAVAVAKIERDYPQVGGMMSGCHGVAAVIRGPLWTVLPGSTPPKGWKPPQPTKAKRFNPWREPATFKDSVPPD